MPHSGIYQCKWYNYPGESFQTENQLYWLEDTAKGKLEYFSLDNIYFRLDDLLIVLILPALV